LEVIIRESRDPDGVIKLFEQHRNVPFTYLMNIPIVRMLSRLEKFRIFVAESNGEVVGCIYSLDYIYDSSYIGGLLVHKDFRGRGIGSRLLKTALNHLNAKYVYLLVVEDNAAAIRLFEKAGFKKAYKRIYYVVSEPLSSSSGNVSVTHDVEWDDLEKSIGFYERKGVINLGYYPVKITREVFESLKAEEKVLKYGSVIAFVEKLHGTIFEGNLYAFNDHILKHLHGFEASKKVVEINPFYIKPEPSDLAGLVNRLTPIGEVYVRTYDGDPVVSKLSIERGAGALIMEHVK